MNRIDQIKKLSSHLTITLLLILLISNSQDLAAQKDPLVVDKDKVEMNANLVVDGSIQGGELKVQSLQVGNWKLKEENGQLVFTNGTQILLIKPLAIGDEYAGGIVFQLTGDGHGLIAAMMDQGKTNWDEGMALCKNYRGGSYNNWRMPNKGELNLMHKNLFKANLGGFTPEIYWSSELFGILPWQQNFSNGVQIGNAKDNQFRVRPVRSF